SVEEGHQRPGVTTRLPQRRQQPTLRLGQVESVTEDADIGATEAVDRLFGVTDHLERDPAVRQALEEAALQRIDVLVLVDQHHREAVDYARDHGRRTEEPQGGALDLAGAHGGAAQAANQAAVRLLEQPAERLR